MAAEVKEELLEPKEELVEQVLLPEEKPEEQGPKSLILQGLPQTATAVGLAQIFTQFGELARVTVKVNPQTGQKTGIGFVDFKEALGASAALAADSSLFFVDETQFEVREQVGRAKGGKGGKGAIVLDHWGYRVMDITQIPPKPGGKEGTRLFIGGIDPSATEEDIKAYFDVYGEVKSLEYEKENRCALVEFGSVEAVGPCLSGYNTHEICGKWVEVTPWDFVLFQAPVMKGGGVPTPRATVYLADLPSDSTKEALEEYGKVYGPVKKAGINNRANAGWVEFESADAVGLVLSTYDAQEILGKKVKIRVHEHKQDVMAKGGMGGPMGPMGMMPMGMGPMMGPMGPMGLDGMPMPGMGMGMNPMQMMMMKGGCGPMMNPMQMMMMKGMGGGRKGKKCSGKGPYW